jgi:hypothetical protein
MLVFETFLYTINSGTSVSRNVEVGVTFRVVG